MIDVWASWCKDCIVGVPKVKELQKEFPDVVFLFLSVDRSNRFLEKSHVIGYNLKGEHYNLPEGMKDGEFVDFINLNWIPRYMVINETGEITLFKATNAADKEIKEALKKNQINRFSNYFFFCMIFAFPFLKFTSKLKIK